MLTAVDQFFLEKGSFSGFVSDKSFRFDTTKSKCIINIFRVTPAGDATKSDGTYTKIETGRELLLKYWDNKGQVNNAKVKLQGAYSALLGYGAVVSSAVGLLAMAAL